MCAHTHTHNCPSSNHHSLYNAAANHHIVRYHDASTEFVATVTVPDHPKFVHQTTVQFRCSKKSLGIYISFSDFSEEGRTITFSEDIKLVTGKSVDFAWKLNTLECTFSCTKDFLRLHEFLGLDVIKTIPTSLKSLSVF